MVHAGTYRLTGGDGSCRAAVDDALGMLAEALGLSHEAVTLHGRLDVAIVADCGRWPADYETGSGVIRLRRGRGGALVHEWGHRIDHLWGGDAFASEVDEPDERGSAVQAVVAAATWRPATLGGILDSGVAEGRLRRAIADFGQRIGSSGHPTNGFEALPAAIAAEAERAASAWRVTEAAMLAALDGFVGRAEAISYGGRVPTRSYAAARALDAEGHPPGDEGPYWSTPREVFARALESLVWRRLGARAHPLLVDPCRRDGAFGGCDPYAVEEEADAIGVAFESVASLLGRTDLVATKIEARVHAMVAESPGS